MSNFIQSPWENLYEALEKSNHRANKDFQSKQCEAEEDCQPRPIVPRIFFSFREFIETGKCTRSFLNNAGDFFGGTNPIPS